MTDAELVVICNGYEKKQKEKKNDIITNAWLTAKLSSFEKMPPLDSLLYKDEESKQKKQQTPEEMINVCKLLNSALGGEEMEI